MIKWLTDNPQAAAGFATAMVALLGIILTFVSLIMTGRQNKAQRAAMKEDREAARLQFEAQREAMQADRETAQTEKEATREETQRGRFTYAIEHLKDESLAIRMGALFELEKLGLDSPKGQENIVHILSQFIREHIEDEQYLQDSRMKEGKKHPQEDVFIACRIVSGFYTNSKEKSRLRAELSYLKAENLDLTNIRLQGASLHHAKLQGAYLALVQLEEVWITQAQLQGTCLVGAKLQGAILFGAQLQGASLVGTQLQGAQLSGASLQGADLVAKQLLDTEGVGEAYLDPDLRTEYDRLKAERDKTNPEA